MRIKRSLTIALFLFGTLTLPVLAQETSAEPLELTEQFSDEATPVQFSYPEGWVTNMSDEASIYTSNSEDTLSQSFGDEFESGQVNILIGAFPLAYLNDELELALEPGTKPKQVMQALVDQALDEFSEAPETLFGEVEDITVNDQRAATVRTGIPGYFGGQLWITQLRPDLYAAVQLVADYDEVSIWEPTALAILDTIRYDEAAEVLEPTVPISSQDGEVLELTETVTSQNGKVTFNYPTDWETIYESNEDSTAIAGNSTSAFGYTLGENIPNGIVSILAGGYSTEEIRDELSIKDEVTAEIVLETVTGILQSNDQTEWTIGEVESLTLNNQPAATMVISGEGFANQNWVIEIEPGIFAFVSLLAHPDELSQWTSTALAIGETVTYNK